MKYSLIPPKLELQDHLCTKEIIADHDEKEWKGHPCNISI